MKFFKINLLRLIKFIVLNDVLMYKMKKVNLQEKNNIVLINVKNKNIYYHISYSNHYKIIMNKN